MTTASLRWIALRGALAGALAFALMGLFALVTRLRDAGALWLAADVLLIAGAVVLLVGGLVWLRGAHARSGTVRAWVTLGASVLLLVAIVVALD